MTVLSSSGCHFKKKKKDFSRLPEPEAASPVTAGGRLEQGPCSVVSRSFVLILQGVAGLLVQAQIVFRFLSGIMFFFFLVCWKKAHTFAIKNNMTGCLLDVLIMKV